ncbi:MAG: phosphate/phosphite/phosphonate ABC transporter substrate-binding protein [Pseudomonadota bacterium]
MRKLFAGLMAAAIAGTAQAEIRIGVLAPQGPEAAVERWQPLMEHLSGELGQPVTMFPVSAQDGTEAFGSGLFDLLLGNPVQTAVVVDTMAAVPLASVERSSGAEFAGVIVARAESGIEALSDLQGRRIGTLGDWAAGGFLFQADYVMQNGLAHPGDLGDRVRFKNQNQIMDSLVAGDIDAAFVRTGILEGWISAGRLSVEDVRVLSPKEGSGPIEWRTTGWFPEWFIVARNGLDARLTGPLAEALIGLEPSGQEATAARITGFREPLDVTDVVTAMQRVGVAPYN